MKPLPRAVFCTRQDNLHNVMMGDVGDYFIDGRLMWFHVKTPAGVAKLTLNRLDSPHWRLIGDTRLPSLRPLIGVGAWVGELKGGRLWEGCA